MYIFYEQAVYEMSTKLEKAFTRKWRTYEVTIGTKDKIFTVQKTEAKENEKLFLRLSGDSPWATKWIRPLFKGNNYL